MTSAHPSSLRLDALALNGVTDAERRELEAHLAACAHCRAESESAATLRAQFSDEVYRQGLRGVRNRMAPPRSWWRMLLPASAALAVAVAAVLIVELPHSAVEPAYSAKGGPSLRLFGRRPGASQGQGTTFVVTDGAHLQAGDQLRFAVANQPGGYLMVASVDGRGHASIYFPFDGQTSAPVTAAAAELPGSVILDDAAGPERLFALWSTQPLSRAAVLSSLQGLAARGPVGIRTTTSLPLGTTSQRTLLVEKIDPGRP